MKVQGIDNLCSLIARVKSPFATRCDVNELIKICYNIALSYLKIKIFNGKLNIARLGLKLNDLAIDCIGELFRQEDTGGFLSFKKIEITDDNGKIISNDLLFIRLKYLVISSANDHLFRLSKNSDPDLGKLIRNIKNNVNCISKLKIEKINGELVLISNSTVKFDHKPLFPDKKFHSDLFPQIKNHTALKSILFEIKNILGKQDVYQNYFPLTNAALIIRKIFIDKNISANEIEIDFPSLEERKKLVKEAVSNIRNTTGNKYITSNKIDVKLVDKYFEAINEILIQTFIDGFDYKNSYYAILNKYMPELSKEIYQENHRTVFEYLNKLTRNEFIELIKMEL